MEQTANMTLKEAIEKMDESVRNYTGVGLPFQTEDTAEAMEKMDRETDEAWTMCRVYLTHDREILLDHHKAWERYHSNQIEAIRKRIDSHTLTQDQKELLDEMHLCYQYDRRMEMEKGGFYRYGMRLRGFSIGCQPMDGLVRCERGESPVPLLDNPNRHYHDILIYNRPLNDHEQDSFELDFLGEVDG